MTRIAVLSLLALSPAPAFSQAEGNGAVAALQALSVEELCSSREIREVWDELERRDLFTSRELRSIKKAEINEDMSEEALLCVKGNPHSIVPVVGWSTSVTFDAYLYPTVAGDALAVFVGHDREGTSVVHVAAGDPEQVAQAIASTNFMCGNSDSARHCFVVDPAAGARLNACGFSEFPGLIAGSAASTRGSGAGAVCASN